jgi:hypothetical protein
VGVPITAIKNSIQTLGMNSVSWKSRLHVHRYRLLILRL